MENEALIEYRPINKTEMNINLFDSFIRYQIVDKCWHKVNNKWIIIDHHYIDDWTKDDYSFLVSCLINTIDTGGLVYGAFINKELKGFVSVEAEIFDPVNKYSDLSSLHISKDKRGLGIGKRLFLEAKRWAKEHGANKLYISSHPSVETQAFYKAMACVEAKSYNQKHLELNPDDRQLECEL